jgi:hypothetical protein
MKRIEFVIAIAMSAAFILASPSNAEADDTACVGALTGTFDNVIVPPGQICHLTNSTVWGNVKALEHSRLRIERSTINGNVEGDKADIVQLFFTEVREQISIKEGGPAASADGVFNVCGFGMGFTPCEVLLAGVTVEVGGIQIEKMVGSVLFDRVRVPGNIKVEANVITGTEFLFLNNTTVDENLQVFKNTGSGQKQLQGNSIGQNLQCFENDPPFVVLFNTASQAEGQCAVP